MTKQPKVPRRRTATRRSHSADPPRIRVRSKLLEQIDESKLAMAFYLIAQQLVEDRTQDTSATLDQAGTSDETAGEATRPAGTGDIA